MNIAVLTGTFPAVSETFIVNQITGLLDAGHRVDIYAWSGGNGAPIHRDIFDYKLIERTRYLNPPHGYVRRLIETPSLLAETQAWRIPAVTLKSLNPIRHGRLAASLNLLYSGVRLASAKTAYDVVHCQFGTLTRIALALRDTGAVRGRLLVSFRGADLTKATNRDEYAQIVERFDMALPVCDAFRSRLVALGCNATKIQVHRSGIRVQRFQWIERRRSAGEPTHILTIARLVEKKGIEFAVLAMARLKASGRRVRYSIVGDGPLRQALENLVEQLHLRQEVLFLGSQNQENVSRLLTEAHVLVVPSVTASDGEQEGIPNVLKEGMAAGLPVVSTVHSGIPELVEHERSGFLVPERDANALADRLGWLIDHPESWAAMGRAGRSRVEADYDTEKLNRSLISLYQGLIRT